MIAAASQSSGNIQKDVANHIMGHVSNTTPGHHIWDKADYPLLQSIYNNKKSNLLDNIGKQDISSLVDFNKLIDLGKKNNLKIELFSSQREFLLNNGIKERENKILKVANNKQRIILQKGVKRIIDKKDMGNLFKVLVLSKWN